MLKISKNNNNKTNNNPQTTTTRATTKILNVMKANIINPFTAVLAALSLEKRPTEVPNLKSLRFFPLFACARERTSTKMHSIESTFVTGPSNMLFAGVSVCTFQPGNFMSWGSEGVNYKELCWLPDIRLHSEQVTGQLNMKHCTQTHTYMLP